MDLKTCAQTSFFLDYFNIKINIMKRFAMTVDDCEKTPAETVRPRAGWSHMSSKGAGGGVGEPVLPSARSQKGQSAGGQLRKGEYRGHKKCDTHLLIHTLPARTLPDWSIQPEPESRRLCEYKWVLHRCLHDKYVYVPSLISVLNSSVQVLKVKKCSLNHVMVGNF